MLSYSTNPDAETNDDFTVLAHIGSPAAGHQLEYDLVIPAAMQGDHVIFRVIYVTGTTTLNPTPELSGVSNTYTACADVAVLADKCAFYTDRSSCRAQEAAEDASFAGCKWCGGINAACQSRSQRVCLTTLGTSALVLLGGVGMAGVVGVGAFGASRVLGSKPQPAALGGGAATQSTMDITQDVYEDKAPATPDVELDDLSDSEEPVEKPVRSASSPERKRPKRPSSDKKRSKSGGGKKRSTSPGGTKRSTSPGGTKRKRRPKKGGGGGKASTKSAHELV